MWQQTYWNDDPGTPVRMHLISRPKRAGLPGRHFGVAVEYVFGGAEVFDLTQGIGMQARSFEEFLQGRRYRVELTLVDEFDVADAQHRLAEVLEERDPHRYHAVDRNCEHVARYVITGRQQSSQVQAGAFLGGLALVALLLRKAG